MNVRYRALAAVAIACGIGFIVNLAGSLRAAQPSPFALTGRVSSAAEGLMEGVLVTLGAADGGVTVISDARTLQVSRSAFGAGKVWADDSRDRLRPPHRWRRL